MRLFKFSNQTPVLIIFLTLLAVLPGLNCRTESENAESSLQQNTIVEINNVRKFLGEDAKIFFALGDWGKNGSANQKKVAEAMALWGDHLNPEFIISTGDNFYCCGVASKNSPEWETNFENVYHQKSLQVFWFPVLGNHDYMGNPQAQIDYTSKTGRWKMLDRYYSIVRSTSQGKKLRFIFLDTNPFVEKYRNRTDLSDLMLMDTLKQILWADSIMKVAKNNQEDIIVSGHHPIYSSGLIHGNTFELYSNFKRLFEQYNVKIYIAGHEHDLQHQKRMNEYTHYFVSGAGSDARPGSKIEGITRFAKSSLGFLILAQKNNTWYAWFANEKGEILYHTSFN